MTAPENRRRPARAAVLQPVAGGRSPVRHGKTRRQGTQRQARPGYRDANSMSPKPRNPPKKPMGGPRTYGRLQRALDDTARREIQAALKEASGNVTGAASLLGISRRWLWKRMAALQIDPQPHRD